MSLFYVWLYTSALPMSSLVQQCFFHLITEQMTEANIELEYIKVTENLNVLQFAEMFHKCF